MLVGKQVDQQIAVANVLTHTNSPDSDDTNKTHESFKDTPISTVTSPHLAVYREQEESFNCLGNISKGG